jgi:hypothetical protein
MLRLMKDGERPRAPDCGPGGARRSPPRDALRTQKGAAYVFERWNVIRSLRAGEAAERFA